MPVRWLLSLVSIVLAMISHVHAQNASRPFFVQSFQIPEVAALISDREVVAKGAMRFSAGDADCRATSFDGEFTVTGNRKLESKNTPSTWKFGFVPGIQHIFRGRVCLPAVGNNASLSKGSRVQGSERFGPGDPTRPGVAIQYLDGSITTSGVLQLDGSDAQIEVTTSGTDPLVLVLTRFGFNWVSGRGKLRTVRRTYTFGEPGI